MRCQPGHFRVRFAIALLGVWACWAACFGSRIATAEEEMTAAQREVEEAKAEDQADRARGEGFSSEKTFSGRLVLGQVVEGRPDVVGLFTIEKAKAYPVKVVTQGLLNELKAHDHKTVSLQGKFRNQGQYFVVTAIIPPPAPTPRVQKVGGL
jgi:hypothetical protein